MKKKDPDLRPDQRRIQEFFKCKSKQTPEILASQETSKPEEPGNGETSKGATNSSPFWEHLVAGPPNQHLMGVQNLQLRYVGG